MHFPPETVTVKLSRPFNVNGKSVSDLTMREPRVIDKILLEKTPGSEVVKEVTMIATLCGLNASDLNNLPGYDYAELVAAFNRFLLPPEARGDSASNSSGTSQE